MDVNDNLSFEGTLRVRGANAANLAASGPIGTAANTVDVFHWYSILQTTANLVFTLPTPTGTVPGLHFRMGCVAGGQPFRMNSGGLVTITPGSWIDYIWTGASWVIDRCYMFVSDTSNGTCGIGVPGTAAPNRLKVGAANTVSKFNIEYSAATPGLGEAGIALYHALNGVAVSTRIQLWNTNVIAARIEFTNAMYTGPGGGNRLVIAAPAGSQGMALVTNELVRLTISTGGQVNIAGVQTFASDAAAGLGGLVAGDLYKSAAGGLFIKL